MEKYINKYYKYVYSNIITYIGLFTSLILIMVCVDNFSYSSKNKDEYKYKQSGYISAVEKNINEDLSKKIFDDIKKETKNNARAIRLTILTMDGTALFRSNNKPNDKIYAKFNRRLKECDIIITLESDYEVENTFKDIKNVFKKNNITLKDYYEKADVNNQLFGGRYILVLNTLVIVFALIITTICNFFWFYVRKKDIYIRLLYGEEKLTIYSNTIKYLVVRIISLCVLLFVINCLFAGNDLQLAKWLFIYCLVFIIENIILSYIFTYRQIKA